MAHSLSFRFLLVADRSAFSFVGAEILSELIESSRLGGGCMAVTRDRLRAKRVVFALLDIVADISGILSAWESFWGSEIGEVGNRTKPARETSSSVRFEKQGASA